MNPMIQLKKPTPLIVTVLSLACFGLAQAVVPPPDGGYPGGNTAEGTNALLSLTTGQYNTAVGLNSLSSNTAGGENTAVGSAALRLNTTGDYNTAVGSYALFRNRLSYNTAVGNYAMYYNTLGRSNTAVGDIAMYYNTTGTDNTAVGDSALIRNTEGFANTVIGTFALPYNTTGGVNTAIGWEALISNTAGSDNTAIGQRAGSNVVTADNVICIGAAGANVSDSCYIGNVWQQPGGSQAVYVNASGKLGAQVSSRRFKDEIKPMEETSEVIYRLKPVSFRYKPEIEPSRPLSFGLVAEEVEKITPNLVTRGSDGKVNSVRYDVVNVMLLNEFLKEHRKVQKLETNDAEQQREIKALVATVKEQAAQIQKVSAQLEANKPAPQVVNNP